MRQLGNMPFRAAAARRLRPHGPPAELRRSAHRSCSNSNHQPGLPCCKHGEHRSASGHLRAPAGTRKSAEVPTRGGVSLRRYGRAERKLPRMPEISGYGLARRPASGSKTTLNLLDEGQ